MSGDAGRSGIRRVAVTGLGLVTPLGAGVEHIWAKLVRGESGLGPIDTFDVDDLPLRISGLVPTGSYDSGGFDPSEWVGSMEWRKMDRFAMYARCAASQARDDSGWRPQTDRERERTGVLVGSGIGGLPAGYGLPGDGFHIAAPPKDGNGAVRAMSAAIEGAGITPDAIDYVNAHATSTQAGDDIGLRTIGEVFGAHTAKPRRISFALSNSFGFGGTNAALVFARPH